MKTSDLKQAYLTAVDLGRDQFTVYQDGEPMEFMTGYAKYLIEYLENIGQEYVVFNKQR